MKIKKFEDRDEWMEARRGRITGTRLKDLIIKRAGDKPKIGYYRLIAERIALPPTDENPMDRGNRIEDDALARFQKETGIKLNTDLVLWYRDDNPYIAISPDGFKGKTIAAEAKCLTSPYHLQAWLTQEVPSEYEEQTLQYFIVNDSLRTLYVIFYDPLMPKDFFYFEVKRKDVKEKVAEYLELEREVLKEIAEIEKKLTF